MILFSAVKGVLLTFSLIIYVYFLIKNRVDLPFNLSQALGLSLIIDHSAISSGHIILNNGRQQ